jgi:hypothetical protein
VNPRDFRGMRIALKRMRRSFDHNPPGPGDWPSEFPTCWGSHVDTIIDLGSSKACVGPESETSSGSFDFSISRLDLAAQVRAIGQSRQQL